MTGVSWIKDWSTGARGLKYLGLGTIVPGLWEWSTMVMGLKHLDLVTGLPMLEDWILWQGIAVTGYGDWSNSAGRLEFPVLRTEYLSWSSWAGGLEHLSWTTRLPGLGY